MADFRSKRLKSIKLKSFLVCFLSLSTLFAAGSATFAWFTTNKRATASYLDIVAQDTHMVSSVQYYAIKEIGTVSDADSTPTYTFDASSQTYIMPTYDRAYVDEKNKLLIKINLKANHEAFTVKAVASGDNTPTEDGTFDWSDIDWDYTDDAKTTYNFPLSTIVKFNSCELVSEVTGSTITVKKSNPVNENKFVDVSNASSPSFTSTLTPLANGESSTSIESIYLMLDYNEEAIAAIYSYNIGNSIFDQEVSAGDSSDSSSSSNNTINWTIDFVITVVPSSN